MSDQLDPARVVTTLVEQVLARAATWTAWDGVPRPVDDRVYTPHKAIRRVADHLVDHLAEIEARVAGVPTIPDHWHASYSTTPADLAPFTVEDLDEARSRLTRLAQIFEVRVRALTPAQLERRDGDAWTPREIVGHLAGSLYYADAIGFLDPAALGGPATSGFPGPATPGFPGPATPGFPGPATPGFPGPATR